VLLTKECNISPGDSDDIERDIDQILDGFHERLVDYFSTSKIKDDELLLFEAILSRHIRVIVRFSEIKTDLASQQFVPRSMDGQSSDDISDAVNYVMKDIDGRLERYFETNFLTHDEQYIFEAILTEKVDVIIGEALLEAQIREVE